MDTREERIHELDLTKSRALGHLLGMIDLVLIAEAHQAVFSMPKELQRLREARDAYRVAADAHLDAILAAS